MTSLKHYDRKIREWCKKPPVAGEVGIELELENVLDANAPDDGGKHTLGVRHPETEEVALPERPLCFLCMESSEHKYAALNLATIRTFNSAEFRFFRPMIDMGQLHAWVLLLHRMVHIASQIPLDETIHSLSLLSPRKFLMTVFTPSQTDMLLASLPEPRAREMLEENEDNVRRIASSKLT